MSIASVLSLHTPEKSLVPSSLHLLIVGFPGGTGPALLAPPCTLRTPAPDQLSGLPLVLLQRVNIFLVLGEPQIGSICGLIEAERKKAGSLY